MGELELPTGDIATEYSIGVEIDGQEVEIPTLVPTLTEDEIREMITEIIPFEREIPQNIVDKSVDHAKKRISEGKSPFYSSKE